MSGERSYADKKIKVTLNTSVRRKVEDLDDVNTDDKNTATGGTLVYESSSNTFVLQGVSTDGGSF